MRSLWRSRPGAARSTCSAHRRTSPVATASCHPYGRRRLPATACHSRTTTTPMGTAIPSRGPRVSQYLTGDPQPGVNQTPAGARQLLFNRGGLLLYGGGTIPFIGDYVDVAPIPFVFNAVTRQMGLQRRRQCHEGVAADISSGVDGQPGRDDRESADRTAAEQSRDHQVQVRDAAGVEW